MLESEALFIRKAGEEIRDQVSLQLYLLLLVSFYEISVFFFFFGISCHIYAL